MHAPLTGAVVVVVVVGGTVVDVVVVVGATVVVVTTVPATQVRLTLVLLTRLVVSCLPEHVAVPLCPPLRASVSVVAAASPLDGHYGQHRSTEHTEDPTGLLLVTVLAFNQHAHAPLTTPLT